MHIMQVLAPGPFGGLERVVSLLSGGLVRRGQRITAALVVELEQTEEPTLISSLRAGGVAVEMIRTPHRRYGQERAKFRNLLKALRPEIVHSHGYHTDVLLRSVAQENRIPVVSTVHGFTTGGLKNRLFEWLERRSLRRMDATVAVSQPLAGLLARDGVPADRLHTIPNGFAPPGEFLSRDAARSRLGIGPNVRVIGWVGRITPEKGPDIMVEALGRLQRRDVELCFIGQGRLVESLRQRVAELGLTEQVRWCGPIPDAWSLFRAFDVYCMSSHTEGTPMALFEAMSAGIPVVTTAVGGIPDVVSEQEARLVPPAKPDALARALGLALESDGSSRAEAALRKLASGFGLEPWLDRYEAVYRALILNRGNA